MAVQLTYFVHGTTTDNEWDLATGWLPGVLSEKGVQQTKALKEQLEGRSFDAVFCSDLQRAVDSAEILFGDTYDLIQDARLRECNYGDLNGTAAAAFKHRLAEYIATPFPNGESYEAVARRLADFIKQLQEQYADKKVAVVAHQGPQLALDVLVKGKSWPQAIAEDWRHTKAWQPGWEYDIDETRHYG